MDSTQTRWTRLTTTVVIVGIVFLAWAFFANVPALYGVAAVWFALAAYFSRKANRTAPDTE